MNKISGLLISLITSILGAFLVAFVLISTIHWGLGSIFVAALAAMVVLALGALLYLQISPQD